MSGSLVLIIILGSLAIVGFFYFVFFYVLPGSGATGGFNSSGRYGGLEQTIDVRDEHTIRRKGAVNEDIGADSDIRRSAEGRLTVRKRIKYANWRISPVMYLCGQLIISLIAIVAATYFGLNLILQMCSLLLGPLVMSWRLNSAVDKRFRAFDADFPQFVMSVVGLLKTGMNPSSALEAAAMGLDELSVVRTEVLVMLERVRFGVSEDRSIGSFAENIYHPEIELFVQALLLGRRMGGSLSDTLERLAKQVRRRQYFRSQASAAVGLQRGSIWFIIGIMVALQIYLALIYPEAVFGAIKDEMGWQIWQFGILTILLGLYWVRQVTKIKI